MIFTIKYTFAFRDSQNKHTMIIVLDYLLQTIQTTIVSYYSYTVLSSQNQAIATSWALYVLVQYYYFNYIPEKVCGWL